jgi:mannitol-1-/sugar-/sorbitol-6-/2-deoxyglucose-6-phosphatase
MIHACVFDMDGVLIDTEPVWRRVERGVFSRVGVELTEEQLRETWGMRIEEVVDHWYRQRPWDGIRPRAVQREIVREMVAHVQREGEPLPGALQAIEAVREAGLSVAIASSSSRELIDAVVDRLEIAHLIDGLCTADDEKLGKPDPAVYRSAARLLGVAPAECIAVEDSPSGLRSAKAAGMVCVVVLTESVERTAIAEADAVIDSLLDMTSDLIRRLASGDDDVSITGRRAT